MSEEVKKEEKRDNNIQISEEVVANIAGMAIDGIKGIAEMSGGFAGGISEVLSGKKNMAKGIKVDIKEGKTKIDVNIIVEYGSRIPDVAYEIQVKAKKAVEDMTGLKVEEVNVHVQGVSTPSKKKEEKKTEEPKKEAAKKPAAKKTTAKKTTKK